MNLGMLPPVPPRLQRVRFDGMTVGVNVSSTGPTTLQNDFGQLYINNGAQVSG